MDKSFQMKMKNAFLLVVFNSFLIGFGFLLSAFIGTTFMTNNVDNIPIENFQGSTKDIQTDTLKGIPYAVLLFTDNNVPKSVLSNIKIEMKDIKTQNQVQVKYEQIIEGFSGSEHYNQIATVNIPENGIYLLTVTILSEGEELDLINPRIIFREGNVFQRVVIVGFSYIIFFVPLVNYVAIKRRKVIDSSNKFRKKNLSSKQFSQINLNEFKYCGKCLSTNDFDSKYCFECGKELL